MGVSNSIINRGGIHSGIKGCFGNFKGEDTLLTRLFARKSAGANFKYC